MMSKALNTLLPIALLFVFFSVTLQEFLFTDDIQNFFLCNSLVHSDGLTSVFQKSAEETLRWMKQGRFAPLSFLWLDGVFMNVPSIMAYRWLVLLMNFAGIGAFLFFLRTVRVKMNIGIW